MEYRISNPGARPSSERTALYSSQDEAFAGAGSLAATFLEDVVVEAYEPETGKWERIARVVWEESD